MSVTSASPTARPARRGLRITRRGRVVLVIAVVALLLAAFSVGRVSSRAAGPEPAATAPAVVVVQPGDTLWSIAKRVAPGADPRPLVTELERVNRLASAALRPGQRLVLPSD